MKLKLVQNEEVNKKEFYQMVQMDHDVWPEDDPSHMTKEYQESLFLPEKEGLFLAVDEDRDGDVVGYFNCIFTTREDMYNYLHGGEFQDLENINLHKGTDNICYLYTANIKPEYRGTGCMKLLGKAFASWLDEQEEKGYEVERAYVEAVSRDGARTITKGFGMEPLEDVDHDGIGHYVSHDGLREYRLKMAEL